MLTIRNAALAVLGSALLQTMFGAMLAETLMGGDARRSLQTAEPVACTKPMCTDGAKTYAEAGAVCSAAGAQLCTGRSVPVAFRGQCRDEGNDCCANEPGGEPASCSPGFSPSAQPTSWDDCNYECVPDFSCTAGSVWVAEESTCPGTTEGTIEPSTADVDVCQDNGNDCCANENSGEPASCADGFSPSAQPTSYDDCPNYECVPDATCVEPTEQRDVLCCMLGAYDERGSFNASLAADGWNCPDEDIRDERPPAWLGAFLVAVHVVPCALIMSLVVCCSFYYRNKSNNTAPWNGQPVQSFEQAATAQAAQMQTVQLQCPEGMVRNPKEKDNAPGKEAHFCFTSSCDVSRHPAVSSKRSSTARR